MINSAGNKWTILINGILYNFDKFSITCTSKVAETPLISGDVYRRRAIPFVYEITLGCRVEHSASDTYRELLAEAGRQSIYVRYGDTLYENCMLKSGSFKSAEGDEKAEFEMTVRGMIVT